MIRDRQWVGSGFDLADLAGGRRFADIDMQPAAQAGASVTKRDSPLAEFDKVGFNSLN